MSAVDVGAATRKGWDGKAPASDQIAMLESVAKQRTAEAAGAAPVYVTYVPKVGDKTAPRDLQEAADYYLTPRGQHPNAPNKMLLTSLGSLVSFTGFEGIDNVLTQPVMIVAGSEAGSLWHSQELHAKAAGPKELFIVDGATHMDLYDGEVWAWLSTSWRRSSSAPSERHKRDRRSTERRRHQLRDDRPCGVCRCRQASRSAAERRR